MSDLYRFFFSLSLSRVIYMFRKGSKKLLLTTPTLGHSRDWLHSQHRERDSHWDHGDSNCPHWKFGLCLTKGFHKTHRF